MLGYFANQEETDKVFKVHSDGLTWVHSDDIGYIDHDGLIYIKDRSKRMIIRPDGHNVWPSEIENVITLHQAVEACAVIGIKTKEYENGMIPTAFIVLKDEYKDDTEKIEQEIDELSSKMLPERDKALDYHFRDSLPLTPIGKIDFKTLEGQENNAPVKTKHLTK